MVKVSFAFVGSPHHLEDIVPLHWKESIHILGVIFLSHSLEKNGSLLLIGSPHFSFQGLRQCSAAPVLRAFMLRL